MTRRTVSRAVWTAVALGVAVGGASSAAGQQPVNPVTVASAVPDADAGTLTISGEHFRASRPFVTLNLIPLNVQAATDARIVAVAPIGEMPPDEYLLTVSFGLGAGESASLAFRIGPAAPAAPAASAAASGTTVGPPSASDPAAKVGDRVITVGEVDAEWRRTDPGGYVGLTRDLYDSRRRVLDQMVADELIAREAAARKTTKEALLAEEIPKRVIPLPDQAALSLYQSLGDLTRGASLEQMRPALRAWLSTRTEPELARMNYVEELMKVSTRADVLLSAPRVTVEASPRDATLGPATAAVQIVAFGDFQSAEYARFAEAFPRVRENYGDRVRIVFKPLPVLGPDSATAAQAAACAQAQGRFWEYHDKLLGEPGPFGSTQLKHVAGAVGLDQAAFDACLDGGTYRDLARQALEEAKRYAVRSSPSFLVNGVLAPDAPPFLPPFEFFTRLIEEELLHQSRTASGR